MIQVCKKGKKTNSMSGNIFYNQQTMSFMWKT